MLCRSEVTFVDKMDQFIRKVLHFQRANVILAACFTLRGHGTHFDLPRFLFLVCRICPLMQEKFL